MRLVCQFEWGCMKKDQYKKENLLVLSSSDKKGNLERK